MFLWTNSVHELSKFLNWKNPTSQAESFRWTLARSWLIIAGDELDAKLNVKLVWKWLAWTNNWEWICLYATFTRWFLRPD